MDNISNLSKNMNSVSVRLMLQPDKLVQRSFLYAREVGYLETDDTYLVDSKGWDAFLFLFVVKEEGKLLYDGREYELHDGTLAFIDCRKPYQFFPTRQSGWRILYLYFNGRQAGGNYEMIASQHPTPLMPKRHSNLTCALLWQIIALHRAKKPYAENLTSLHITKLLTDLSITDGGSDNTIDYPEYIHYVFHYIAQHYDKKITLDMLSQQYSISKFHLSREFKRYTGKTLNAYIVEMRLNEVKSLLRYTDESIEKIALEVGFCNASHLIRCFREEEALTPNMYRSQWRG